MNMAAFFQKHERNKFVSIFKGFYLKTRKSNAKRVKYLTDAGAKIGEGSHVGSIAGFGTEPYLVEVGSHVYISGGVAMHTHDGGTMQLYHMGLADKKYDNFGKIKIGDHCFIGHGSVILKNVTIGENCIIGAGSVVSKSIPAGHVAAGVPARVIGTVEEYYEKNKALYDDTLGMNSYQKRLYIEQNMQKYEERRIAREARE